MTTLLRGVMLMLYYFTLGRFTHERTAISHGDRLVQRPPGGKKGAAGCQHGVAVYLLYLGLLAWLAWHAMWVPLGVTAVVPAAAFVVGTALRAAINRPRPYTKYGFVPLFPKDKTGQSMPSRHCFSAAAIAAAVWYVLPPLGAVLAVLAVIIAVSRVVTGVHFVSDVLVFAVAGRVAYIAAASALGFYAIMVI